MEFVDGASLAHVLRAGQNAVDPTVLCHGLLPIARALDYAHERGVIHRDIKPANILVSKEAGTFKVADFGIAKVLAASELTVTGTVIGTPQYMSPENLRGNGVTPSSDQYALGIVAYEVLTGRVPFQAESMEALMFQILLEQPPPVESLQSALNPALNHVLQRVLGKDPMTRYGSCTEFMEQLLAAMSADSQAPPPKPPDPQQQSRSPSPSDAVPVFPSPFLSQKQRTPLWKPILYGLVIALVLSIVIFYFVEKSRVAQDGYRVPKSIQTITLPAKVTPPRTVDTPPPIRAGAANSQYPDNPRMATGPRRPKAWFRFHYPGRSRLEMALLGGDGTYYVGSSDEHIWAVRNGKVRWGYGPVYRHNLSALRDGRVVIGETVLNADGEGGSVRGAGTLPDPIKRLDDLRSDSQAYGGTCRSPNFSLDGDCENMASDERGITYLLTATKNIYAYAADGSRRWVVSVPCRGSRLMFASEGQLVLGCRGSADIYAAGLIGVRDGKVTWRFRPDSDVEIQIADSRREWVLAVDRSGTVYFVDSGNRHHLYAVSRDCGSRKPRSC